MLHEIATPVETLSNHIRDILMAKKRKSGGETACLRILHLSDFHFRLDRRWDQDPVLAGLTDSIEKLVGDGLGRRLGNKDDDLGIRVPAEQVETLTGGYGSN